MTTKRHPDRCSTILHLIDARLAEYDAHVASRSAALLDDARVHALRRRRERS